MQDEGATDGKHRLQIIQAGAFLIDAQFDVLDKKGDALALHVEAKDTEHGLIEDGTRGAKEPPDLLTVQDDPGEGQHGERSEAKERGRAVTSPKETADHSQQLDGPPCGEEASRARTGLKQLSGSGNSLRRRRARASFPSCKAESHCSQSSS